VVNAAGTQRHAADNPWVSTENAPPAATGAGGPDGVRLFRAYAGLTFAFAWIPVMYTAFTVDRGFTASQYLRLWSAYYLAMVLAELPWGWVADRFGKRPLLVAGPLWLGACFVVLGEATRFEVCWVVMAATGAGHAMISGADSAYLYELLAGAGRRPDALREETVAHRWRLFGVSIMDVAGGFVAAGLGTRWAFHLSALVMLAAGLVALRLPAPGRGSAPLPRPRVGALLGALVRPGVLWVLAWYVAVFVLLRVGFQLYQPTLLAVGTEDLRVHGLLLGALNLVAGLAAFFVLRVHGRWGEARTASGVLCLLAVSFLGLSGLAAWWLLPLFCLQQVSLAFLQPLGRTALNHRSPAAERTTLLSAQSMLARLAFGCVLLSGHWDAALGDGLGGTYLGLALAAAGLAALFRMTRAGRRFALETGPGG
jgi:MFS family permease